MDIGYSLGACGFFYALGIKRTCLITEISFRLQQTQHFSFHNMLLLRFQENVTLKQIF